MKMALNTLVDGVTVDEAQMDSQSAVLVFRLGSGETEGELLSLLASSLNVPAVGKDPFVTYETALGMYRLMACIKIRFVVDGITAPAGLIHGIMACLAVDQSSLYRR